MSGGDFEVAAALTFSIFVWSSSQIDVAGASELRSAAGMYAPLPSTFTLPPRQDGYNEVRFLREGRHVSFTNVAGREVSSPSPFTR